MYAIRVIRGSFHLFFVIHQPNGGELSFFDAKHAKFTRKIAKKQKRLPAWDIFAGNKTFRVFSRKFRVFRVKNQKASPFG